VLRLKAVAESELVVDVVREGDVFVLTCRGSAESTALAELTAKLESFHASAVEARANAVIADFRELTFVSTPCLKAFVSWLQWVQELDDDKRYRVRFQSNPMHRWQVRSLASLRAFAGAIVEIEPITDTSSVRSSFSRADIARSDHDPLEVDAARRSGERRELEPAVARTGRNHES